VTVNFQAVILVEQLDTMISSDGNFSDIHYQFDTMISSERERAFLLAEMSVFLEDEFTEYFVDG